MKKINKRVMLFSLILILVVTSVITIKNIKNNETYLTSEDRLAKTYTQVKSGDEKISTTNYVTFDAYYLRDLDGDGYAEKLRGTCKEIGMQDTLYMDLNVLTNGTLKNGKITINGENFVFSTALVKDNVIAKDYISSDTREIKLNELNAGTQKLIFGIVQSGDYSSDSTKASAIGNDTNKYSVTTNSITLTGTHVADDGTQTEISKTVNLTNDWYGTTQATVSATSQTYDSLQSSLDEVNQKVTIDFKVSPTETKKQLILQKNHTEIKIPQLNGYDPVSVTTKNNDIASNYNEETHMLTIEKNAVINEKGIVTGSVSRNLEYNISVVYPYEAYQELGADTIVLSIPIETYFEGYNNSFEEFENPYKSNVAKALISVTYRNPQGRVAIVDVTVGKYTSENGYTVSKEKPLNIYNQIESDTQEDIYPVTWYAYTGTESNNCPLVLKETPTDYTDRFQDVNSKYTDMLEYISNIGIYFSNPQNMLGDNGYINVYNDETNELIHTFTSKDWNSYSSTNPYRYGEGIKHIRIETSNVNVSSSLYVYHLKQIDDVLLTANFTKEEFEDLSKIYSYLTGYFGDENTNNLTYINSDIGVANYLAPYSKASIHIDPNYFSNQETKYNEKITISTDTTSFNTKKWTNGVFLIKYPEEIINVEISSVSSTDNNIVISAVDTYTENANVYTKIYTENEIEKNVNLVINANMTADPRITTSNKIISMYYYNPGCHNYKSITEDIYDLDGNSNIAENMGLSTTSINLIAPSNLLTSQTATNFDDKNTTIIAPQEADINKLDGSRTADINVSITNNYSNTISEIKIVGSIPFEGNKYQLNNAELGSEFTTTLLNEINIPEELKPYATVYYSEKKVVTEDINATKNAWTTKPDDMSKVKSYLISLGDYVLPVNKSYEFSYTVQVPGGVKYNQVSYADHAVYYCLDTNEGKLKTQTEPNKLGLRIAEKYDLEITKYELNSDKKVSQTVFVAKDKDSNSKTSTTTNEGIATLKNLYVEKEYIVKEIATNTNYILNPTETKIIGHVVDGKIEIEVLEGGFKNSLQVEEKDNANSLVKAEAENEVKVNVILNKVDSVTGESIQGIKFKLTDYNGRDKIYTTSSDGILTLRLLEPNKQYTLTETDSKGHYLKAPVTFMIIRDENRELKLNVLSGELSTSISLDKSGEIPVFTTEMSNEKIPTYSLRITKKETDTDTTLQGAQFKLTGENKEDNILYTTDENGIIQIDNLYQYVEGKDITGKYTLTELYPTEGYTLNDTPIEFRVVKDSTNNVKLELENGTIRENVEDVQIDYTNPDNPIVNITIDNDPVFTLTKIDANTKEPLEGVGFEITDLDGNYVKDANGDWVGIRELAQVELISSGNYPWTQNEDGTWQSGNQENYYTTSTLTTTNFTVEEDATIYFDWSVSSYSRNYLYITIKNLDNNKTIGGNKDGYRISGTSMGTEYEKMIYERKEIDLEPGNYKVEFRYYREFSPSSGLNTGYVKNVKVITRNKNVLTDSNGKIRLSLTQGLYKATETSPLTGYATPELYTGIGIGESKEVEYDNFEILFDIKSKREYYTQAVELIDGFVLVSETGNIIRYDLDGNIIWENNEKKYSYKSVTKVNDGIVIVADNGAVIKCDLNGRIVWENNEKNYSYQTVIQVDNGVIVASFSGQVVKYDLNGNIIWENKELRYAYESITNVDDGIIVVGKYLSNAKIVKYSLEGNIEWESTQNPNWLQYCDNIIVDDGIIVVGYNFYDNNAYMEKYDFYGNKIWRKTESNQEYYGILLIDEEFIVVGSQGCVEKYDLDGNLIWKNIEKSYSYRDVIVIDNKIFAISYYGQIVQYDFNGNFLKEDLERANYYYGVTIVENNIITMTRNGSIAKYDLNGNIIWKNTEKSYFYNDLLALEDGVIAIGREGRVVKYNLGGMIEWENSEKSYNYIDATILEDGIVAINENGKVVKYDLEGNIEWEKYSFSYSRGVTKVKDGIIVVNSDGVFVKFDLEGNIVWRKATSSSYNELYVKIVEVEDGAVALGSNGYLTKIDLDGNFKWIKNISNSGWESLIALKDGIVVIGNKGQVIRYDLDGNRKWSNLEKSYSYINGTLAINNEIIVISTDGHIVKYKNHICEPEIPNSLNLIVENEYQKYKITTKVNGDGGNISGKDELPYEEVVYLKDSTKDIIATPDNGYKVQSITINGEDLDFIEEPDGTVKLDKFYQMTEDKEIIVSFVKKDSVLVIKKLDSVNFSRIANAKFNIQNVETREEPVISSIAGDIVANGTRYEDITVTLEDEIKNFEFGELTNNGTYHFEQSDEGKYVSNNTNISSSTSNSYIKVNLTNYEGDYALVVNANVSSENNYDFGYATITENTTAPSYSNTAGRFIYISGNTTATTTPKDYQVSLEGGKVYYLHLGYRKDGSGNTGEDKFTVNSVKLYNATVERNYTIYNFVDNGNGGYESNNQGVASTVANSYIPLDLTEYKGKYTLTVNANVSSQSGSDYGYATVTDNTTAPVYNNEKGRFIYISGTSTSVTASKDYTTVLEGGKIYYLHFGYYKNANTDSGLDKFTINSINISLNRDDFINEEYITNANGEIILNDLPEGRYKITEIEAPEGYTLDSTPIYYDMVAGQENILEVKNKPQTDLLVHHYLVNTKIPLADDENYTGDVGEKYTTAPRIDINRYELMKDEEGEYVIPENATGTYDEDTIVVTYYYEDAPVKLIVHHYLDGTEDSVAPDEISEWEKGESYTTNPVEAPDLDEKYELVTTRLPENAAGTLENDVTEVTYYYKVKEFKVTTEVDGVGGDITGKTENPYETVLYKENSVKDITITPDEGYKIESITVNGIEQELPENLEEQYTLNKFENVTENKHIIVKFTPSNYNVSIEKEWIDNNNELSKRPELVIIQVYNDNKIVNEYELNDKISIVLDSIAEDGSYIPYSNYTFIEKEKNTNDLLFYNSNIQIEGYNVKVTNTFEIPKEKRNIEVTKNWIDTQETLSKRPSQIKLVLKADGVNFKDEIIDVTSESTQTYTFRDLLMYNDEGNLIEYTIDEEEINEGDLKFYSKQVDGYNITNTFEVPDENIELNVTKNWEDNNNENNIRPDEIKISILANGSEYKAETLNVDKTTNRQEYNMSLPKYDEVGNEIKYTVDEEEIAGYTKNISDFEITNTIKSYKITTEVDGIGGDITGKEDNPYEVVTHGGTSIKDITATPDSKYKIVSITVNGEEIEFKRAEDGTYTLDKFINVTEDKHIVVRFEKKETKVVVNYKEVETEKILSPEIEILGKIDDTYNTEDKIEEINTEYENKYEFVNIDGQSEGVMEEDTIYITYWYQKKQGEIEVKYLEYNSDIVLAKQENSFGQVDSEYTTIDKIEEINSKYNNAYELVTVNGNKTGIYTLDKQIITYYYQKKGTKVITRYKDIDTDNEIYEAKVEEGRIGDNYSTVNELDNINLEYEDKYEFVKVDGNEKGNMTEDTILVTYYYQKRPTSVITKYVDIDTNEEIYDSNIQNGKIDDNYTTRNELDNINLKFEDKYDFVKSTDNTKGTMTKEQIEVVYYYSKKNGKVIVKYKDIDTEEELAENEIIENKIDTEYVTEDKIDEINENSKYKYEFVKVVGEVNGKITLEEQEIIYYYRKIKSNVIVKYVDEETGKEIIDSITIEGNIGDKYETKEKDIEGYELIKEKIPENKNGEFEEKAIEIIYYYNKVKEEVNTSDINVYLIVFISIISICGVVRTLRKVYYK